MSAAPSPADPTSAPGGRFTLERLSSAFARLMGAPTLAAARAAPAQVTVDPEGDLAQTAGGEAPVTPRMIVEGMLFVGAADGRPLTSAEMASQIRNVAPQEVDAIVAELNRLYRADEAAYEVAAVDGGYRLQLRHDLAPVRQRFKGEVKAARLTPPALEVLSIVAYRQGVTGDEINRLRGASSYAILAQLVRRQLVQVQRNGAGPRSAHYHTTERFNRLFGVSSPADLPRSEDLEDS